jgi:hypothetical protein
MKHAYFPLLMAFFADTGLARDGGVPEWAPRIQQTELKDSATYRLRKSGEGFVWENAQFIAVISRDGLVTFQSKHASVSHSIFPQNVLSKLKKRVVGIGSVTSPKSASPFHGAPWLPLPPSPPKPHERTIEQEIRCPPSSGCYRIPPEMIANLVDVTGTFDLSHEMMRSQQQDPDRLEKAHFLSATFEFRIKLAIENYKTNQMRIFERLPSALDELWSDERYTPRERRRILYELWIELDLTPEGDRAAQIIQDFVRRQLPCGSSNTYSKGELEGFVKTRKDQKFLNGETCERIAPPVPR